MDNKIICGAMQGKTGLSVSEQKAGQMPLEFKE